MALGILNNLSAIYAENNLNNTNSSLQTVLQQLSSGSRINSGADDAAGLSLVNGLGANSVSLSQSETNSTEGVGLLQVADGALSQVTSLLNRGVTLATETSNGTLNGTQDEAANQEYQTIMAEVNNIGSTTTYNQQQVFDGVNLSIYTGDSSAVGASMDNLYIRTLSEASVGDSNGVMSYADGDGASGANVFLDLSNNGTLASLKDNLNASGTTSIQVAYLTTGANGTVSEASTTISAGTGTSYANTVQGLMNAINGSGLGLTATFGTAAEAGAGATSTASSALYGGGSSSDTGIVISGEYIGVGTSVGQIGALTVGGTSQDPLAGTLGMTASNGALHTITLGQADTTDNITDLAATINADDYGITATVSGNTITFTSASAEASVSGSNLTDTILTVETGTSLPQVASGSAPLGNAAGTIGTVTLQNATDILTGGTLEITGQSGMLTSFTLGTPGTTDNLTDLAQTINNWALSTAGAGITAIVTSGVLTINSAGGGLSTVQTALTGTSITSDSVASSGSSISLTGTPATNSANISAVGTLTIGGSGESVTDVLNGTLAIGSKTIILGGAGTTDTLQNLAKTINAGDYGVTATYSQANKDIVFTSSNSALSAVGALTFTAAAGGGDQTDATGTVTFANATPPTAVQDYYNIGISSSVGIQDQSTAFGSGSTTYGGTLNTGFTTDPTSPAGIVTISYSDNAGESLAGTDLLNQSDAQVTLSDLNVAISDVAALDGYIGAQINILNSISQVMGTQQENVLSAQNAIQATDYASATSNMSKYEVLSQTGIAALAQANSVQQEVTKLLQ